MEGLPALTLNNTVLKTADNEACFITADNQFTFDGTEETGGSLAEGFSLCSNGSLTHQLDAKWYLCDNDGIYNIFTQNVLPAVCSLVRLQVLGTLPPLGSPITSAASSAPNPTASTSHSSASSSPTSSESRMPTPGAATLSTGDKAAIGVAVPVGVLGIAVVLYLIWRRRGRTSTISPSHPTTGADWEKPELQDDSYDPAIAGPVRKKPELEAKSSHISELPHHSSDHIDSHEIAADVPISSRQSGSSATQVVSTSRVPSSRMVSRPAGNPVQGTSTTASATRRQAVVEPSKAENQDELTEEYDTLISEIGVISKRKKALNGPAMTAGVRPEDLQGRKGAEYRQLTQREEGVRARMEEVQNALESNKG